MIARRLTSSCLSSHLVWISSTGAGEAEAGVVYEHVQPTVALAVRGDHLLDRRLLRDVRGDPLHLEPIAGKLRHGPLELLRFAWQPS